MLKFFKPKLIDVMKQDLEQAKLDLHQAEGFFAYYDALVALQRGNIVRLTARVKAAESEALDEEGLLMKK